jgi:predicted ATPase
MSAVDLAFMKDFETLNPSVKNKKTSELTDFIEEMLNVKFELRRAPPRYAVNIKGLEIPLATAPSGYRELAPLALALRHRTWHSMFIEEPEAHLHPDAQTIVARAVAEASKRGVDIIATTHSIYVLDEISNLLRLNKLSKKKKEELGYKNWEGLSPEDIAIYFVSKEGDVELIEVSEDGLSETGLDEITLEMANKHAAVERSFKKGKT